MPTPTGNANHVRTGAGKISFAPWTTPTTPPVMPTTLAGSLDAAFKEVGFTTDGSEYTYSASADPIEVAERLSPIRQVITGVERAFEFTMAQISPQNLALATNAPASSIVVNAADVTFNWPRTGGIQRVAIVWDSDDGLQRTLFHKCYAIGDITIPHRKGAEPSAINVSFAIEENTAAAQDVQEFFDKVTWP